MPSLGDTRLAAQLWRHLVSAAQALSPRSTHLDRGQERARLRGAIECKGYGSVLAHRCTCYASTEQAAQDMQEWMGLGALQPGTLHPVSRGPHGAETAVEHLP